MAAGMAQARGFGCSKKRATCTWLDGVHEIGERMRCAVSLSVAVVGMVAVN